MGFTSYNFVILSFFPTYADNVRSTKQQFKKKGEKQGSRKTKPKLHQNDHVVRLLSV